MDTLLLRGIEVEDSAALVLTIDDRRFATQAALGDRSVVVSPHAGNAAAFLGRRAHLALARLTARYSGLARVENLSRWPAWLSWGIPLFALVLGLSSNVVGQERLNILAFPLLGMIVWNIAIYVYGLVKAALAAVRSTPLSHPLLRVFEWVVRPASARLAGHPTLERGVSRFAGDWARASAPLTHARASRSLHLGAAAFAVGVLAGMLVRARYSAEYSAGWSGTWAGAEVEIATLLKLILGPATLVTGIELPDVERLRELRGRGENAGNWLILWSVTATLVVIIPRLLLALIQGARAAYLARTIIIPEDFYVRSLLRNALGRQGTARVIPYGLAISTEVEERLARLITAAMGEKTVVKIDPAIAYGGEDEWLAIEGEKIVDADQLILLFNLASTPEAENHGALVAGVWERLSTSGTALLVLLDDSSFRQKLRGQSSADARLHERLEAWKSILAANAVTPATVTLDKADEAASARELERAFHRTEVQT